MVGRLIFRVITLDLGVFGERTVKVEFIHMPAERPCVEYPLGADEDFQIFTVTHIDDDGEHEELDIWKLFVGNDSAYAELISAIKETRK